MRHAFPLARAGRSGVAIFVILMLAGFSTNFVSGAGMLTASSSADQPIRIKDHHVDVTINNGFARTEVTQTFVNPNARDLEAIYSFPLPKSASLSEVTVWNGEKTIRGEVVEKQEARRIYQQERQSGNDAAIGEKNAFYTFDFQVTPVRANSECKIQFVYYQPLEIDTGVGRYVYPLREGGTDDPGAASFWSANAKVENTFSADIELKSAWPVANVRVAGWNDLKSAPPATQPSAGADVAESSPTTAAAAPDGASTEKLADGHWKAHIRQGNGAVSLDRDLVFYYRLAENLPGRIEMVAHRADKSKPGTFMLVLTPGLDLKPLTNGADYVFVLDVSGSMFSKIQTLADGVTKVLEKMRPEDRFRVITFNSSAHELVPWTSATQENVKDACRKVKSLRSGGSTNLYDAVSMALSGLDDDRATSIVLVTDGVTNTGEVNPAKFDQLMRSTDVRVFGFLMGNSSNWPLMRTICDASGGFYAGVSNDDDIVGQILLAKNKITHEALHDAHLKITGVEAEQVSDVLIGKVYCGQQFVMFGRYDHPGRAKVTLAAKLTGQDKTYAAEFDLPESDTANPEIERLWALDQIEQIEAKRDRGQLASDDARGKIRDLGLSYQLVTDYTSMLVLSDEAFTRNGIARENEQRIATERTAQTVRATQAPVSHQIDKGSPALSSPAPSLGNGSNNGGGAIDPIGAAIVLSFAGLVVASKVRRRAA